MEESMLGTITKPFGMLLSPLKRLITYVYPLLLSYFATLHYMNNGYRLIAKTKAFLTLIDSTN